MIGCRWAILALDDVCVAATDGLLTKEYDSGEIYVRAVNPDAANDKGIQFSSGMAGRSGTFGITSPVVISDNLTQEWIL